MFVFVHTIYYARIYWVIKNLFERYKVTIQENIIKIYVKKRVFCVKCLKTIDYFKKWIKQP